MIREHIFCCYRVDEEVGIVRRWIMHVDMDAFFASVEQRDRAELRGKPVIVGGLSGRGVVATASYEARVFGVHSAMPMAEARIRCPQGVFLQGNHRHYEEVSAVIFSIFHDFAPLVEPLSIDEAFLDVSGMEKIAPDLVAYAQCLKERIKQKTGLIASVGVAPNKFLAKLASDLKKPDGLVLIRYGKEESIMRSLPVRKIWGIGKKSAEKLNMLGFCTAGDLAKADKAFLTKHFGKAAAQFVDLAKGLDERAVEADRVAKSIGNEITFEEDLAHADQIERNLLALAEKVGWRLRIGKFVARTISVKIRLASFQTITRNCTLSQPTQFDEEIYQTALSLYRQIEIKENVRLLGVYGDNLSKNEQYSLLQEDKRQKALYAALDGLKDKFGESIITKANLLKQMKKEPAK